MSFLLQFQPVSSLSFLLLGFVFFQLYLYMHTGYETLVLIVITLGLSWITGYRKVSAIFIGLFLGLNSSIYLKKEIPDTNFREKDFADIKKQNEIQIHFKKEIKRNFYESEIQINKKTITLITKRYKKDIFLPTLLCNSNQISLKKVSPEKEYFRFLFPFEFSYIQIQENKCKLIEETIDPRKHIRQKVEELLKRAEIKDIDRDIAMGLFFGDASYLESEFKEKVREGGILHLFAASGLHIGVFIGFLYFLAQRICFFNYYTEKIFPLCIAFSYLYLLNFPVSLLRAYTFTSILILGSLFFRKMKSIDLIIVSSGVIFLIDRENFLTLSFILSYSAVCGILFLKKPLDSLVFGSWKNAMTENFTISISASIGTFPVLIYYFKSFSFGSIFLNLLLVPLTSLLLPLLYISLFLQFCFESLFENFFWILLEVTNPNFCKESSFLLWFWNFTHTSTEIFWTYSELLLRLLAFLSENLSEKVGFFRDVKESYLFHLSFYISFLLFLILFIVANEWASQRAKKNKKMLPLLAILAFLFIGSFFYFGYILFPEQSSKKSFPKNISASSDYYLVKEKNAVYLGGICKYSHFKIKEIIKQGFCDISIESIFVEEESCLVFANLCQKEANLAKIYSAKKWIDWENTYSHLEMSSIASNRKFSNLIIYFPHLDPLSELQKYSKTDKGNILLLFAHKLNDNAKDWNQNKNVLGINPNWNFITPDEL